MRRLAIGWSSTVTWTRPGREDLALDRGHGDVGHSVLTGALVPPVEAGDAALHGGIDAGEHRGCIGAFDVQQVPARRDDAHVAVVAGASEDGDITGLWLERLRPAAAAGLDQVAHLAGPAVFAIGVLVGVEFDAAFVTVEQPHQPPAVGAVEGASACMPGNADIAGENPLWRGCIRSASIMSVLERRTV